MTKPAITFMDGFDAYRSWTNLATDLSLRWGRAILAPVVLGSGVQAAAPGRGGGGGLYLSAGGNPFRAVTALATGAPGLLVGSAVRPTGAGNSDGLTTKLLRAQDASGADVIAVTLDDLDRLRVVRNGTTVLAGPSSALTGWQYVEFLVVCDPTAGSYAVRVDGATVLSGSGVNTSGGVSCDRFVLGNSAALPCDLDDLYLCDLTGQAGRDFYGDLTVRAIAAVAQGALSDWAASGDPSKVADVAWSGPATVDAGTIVAGTIGNEDLYLMDAGAVGADPVAVAVVVSARKTDTTSRSIGGVARAGSGGTDVALGTAVLGASFGPTDWLMATDPTRVGSAWTRENLRDTQFGVKVAA